MHCCCSFRAPFQRAWKERRRLFASILCIVRRRHFSYNLSHVFISTVLLISLGFGVFVLHFNNVLSTREGEIGILDLCWYLLSILHPSPSPFSSPSLLRSLFSSPPAVSTGRMPGGSWGSDSSNSSSGVKEGKTTLKRGEKGESKGKIDRKVNGRRIRQKSHPFYIGGQGHGQ